MLQISDSRERAIVRAADVALGAVASIARRVTTRQRPDTPQRILLLRLERIGDLLMALPAIRDVRSLAPSAEIDLVVGSWNAALARAIPSVTRVMTLDARWLARDAGGLGMPALINEARRWRSQRYDLAINFEPDVRSNLLLAFSGAMWTVGWTSGGGGAVLDRSIDFDPGAHTIVNARRLVRTAFDRTPADSARPLITIPDSAVRAANDRLGASGLRPGPRIGMHVSGGRAIKQWDVSRFAEVAARLIDDCHATVVLTGSPADRPLINKVKSALMPRHVVDASGDVDLVELAAMLQQLDLLVTGDTGPMHVAYTVGTPVVAVFGPSAPQRYGPLGPFDGAQGRPANRIIRVDLPCSPCNRIRQPPSRCIGHTPDCLTGVSVDAVFDAARSILDQQLPRRIQAGRS
jgi:ADP-heptose:LPS heptosyltransferase